MRKVGVKGHVEALVRSSSAAARTSAWSMWLANAAGAQMRALGASRRSSCAVERASGWSASRYCSSRRPRLTAVRPVSPSALRSSPMRSRTRTKSPSRPCTRSHHAGAGQARRHAGEHVDHDHLARLRRAHASTRAPRHRGGAKESRQPSIPMMPVDRGATVNAARMPPGPMAHLAPAIGNEPQRRRSAERSVSLGPRERPGGRAIHSRSFPRAAAPSWRRPRPCACTDPRTHRAVVVCWTTDEATARRGRFPSEREHVIRPVAGLLRRTACGGSAAAGGIGAPLRWDRARARDARSR